MANRRKNKMSREYLAEQMNIPINLLIEYERAVNPVLTLQLKERFKQIFNLKEEDLRNDK